MKAAAAPTGKFSLPCEGVALSVLEQEVLLLLLVLLRDPVPGFASNQNFCLAFGWLSPRCWLAIGSLLARLWLAFGSLLARLWLAIGSLLARFWLAFASFCVFSLCYLCVLSVFSLRLLSLPLPPTPNPKPFITLCVARWI